MRRISLAPKNLRRLSLEIRAILMVRQLYSFPVELAIRITERTAPKEVNIEKAKGRAMGRPRISVKLPIGGPPPLGVGRLILDIANNKRYRTTMMPTRM
jgi:hypothetical protein